MKDCDKVVSLYRSDGSMDCKIWYYQDDIQVKSWFDRQGNIRMYEEFLNKKYNGLVISNYFHSYSNNVIVTRRKYKKDVCLKAVNITYSSSYKIVDFCAYENHVEHGERIKLGHPKKLFIHGEEVDISTRVIDLDNITIEEYFLLFLEFGKFPVATHYAYPQAIKVPNHTKNV